MEVGDGTERKERTKDCDGQTESVEREENTGGFGDSVSNGLGLRIVSANPTQPAASTIAPEISIAVLVTPNMTWKLATAPNARIAPKTAMAKLNLVEREENTGGFGDSVGNGLGVPAGGAATIASCGGGVAAMVSTADFIWLTC